jgi:hypothetical protein
MKKIILLTILITLTTLLAVAQWSTNNPHIYYNNGNVGIGTTSPNERLEINGGISILGANSTSSVNGFRNSLQFVNPNHAAIVFQPASDMELMFGFHSNGNFYWGTGRSAGNRYVMQLSNYGDLRVYRSLYTPKISVGTSEVPVGYRLAVAGKVIAEEVVVKLQSQWPDYVFKPEYTLRPLAEVEAHIQTHGHLPDMPSAQQVEENGVGLSEMNALLLKKVEELTLYSIEQEKRLKMQGEEIEELKRQNRRIEDLVKCPR